MKFIKCSEWLPEIKKRVLFKTKRGTFFSGFLREGFLPISKKDTYFAKVDFSSVSFEISLIESWAELPEAEE